MTITKQEARFLAASLKQRAKKHRDLLGESSLWAPLLETAAQALLQGEALIVARHGKEKA